MNLIARRNRSELGALRNDFDEWMGRFLRDLEPGSPDAFQPAMIPLVNVSETDKQWTVSFELPGLVEKDIQVQILGRQLVVSGERKWEEEKKGKEFHRVESRYGSFRRSIQMPDNARLEPDSVMASYKKGMLEISVPKVEPTPAAKIPVKAGS
jgi:HSP20 family protein